ncbi:MAG: hypothetical protein KVP17_003881 [Porospora cf. gigantea B]|uniref:uncharacterized protein n=1 Tax=Porospora cf. gigantea B TaxID=2853592 RepID=UPI003571D4EC|nr:MAG: hypothetical protein KVP17_003881 [Porospora cf. gigantea B]
MYWNVDGLQTSRAKVEALMGTCSPDVVLLFECRQTVILPPRGFHQLWLQETSTRRGGTVCWVRQDLKYLPLLKYATPENERSYLMELIVIQIDNTVIGGVYVSPQTPTTALSALLDRMTPYRRGLLVGDFNARHKGWCTMDKPRGRLLAKRAAAEGWTIVVPLKPTFVQVGARSGKSTIDLAMARGVHVRPVVMLAENEGHRPLCITVVEGCRSLPEMTTMNDVRRRQRAEDWYNSESQRIETLIADQRTGLDQAYAAYEKFVTQPFQRKIRYPTPRGNPLDNEIADAAGRKKKALRQGDAALAASYRRKLRTLVRRRRRMMVDHTTREEPLSSSAVASRIRGWSGAHAEKAALGIHLAADDFRRFLQLRSGPDAVNMAEPTEDPLPLDFLQSLVRSIKAAPRNKAVGTDAIRAEFLKLAPLTHARIILSLLRRSLTEGALPTRWTEAIVRPLLKPAKPASEPASYRPVSILSHTRKIVEASLLRYLLEAYQPHASQYAYIPGRRILSAVKQVDTGIKKGLDTVCLDLTSAFDMVDKYGVAARLRRVGLRQSLTSAILLKLSSTRNTIKIGNTVSPPFSTTRGVPQGGCLSPVLFLMVMDALACRVSARGATPTLYSDDVAIQGNPLQIQRALEETQEWETQEGMKLSVTKTWAMSSTTFLYRNAALQNLSEGRYLGLILDPGGLNSKRSVESRLPLVETRANLLRFAGGVDRSSHPIHLRNQLLTFVCGAVRYGEQVLSREAITELRQAIAKVVKKAFGLERCAWTTLRALIRFREIGQTPAESILEAAQTEATLRTLRRTAHNTGTSTLLKALPKESAWYLLRWWTGFSPDPRKYGPARARHTHRFHCWETLARAPNWTAIEKSHMVRETAWLIEAIYSANSAPTQLPSPDHNG